MRQTKTKEQEKVLQERTIETPPAPDTTPAPEDTTPEPTADEIAAAKAQQQKAKAKQEHENEQRALKSISRPISNPQTARYQENIQQKARQGLLCPNKACRSQYTEVKRTVHKQDTVTRHRVCKKCGVEFTTEEKPR